MIEKREVCEMCGGNLIYFSSTDPSILPATVDSQIRTSDPWSIVLLSTSFKRVET